MRSYILRRIPVSLLVLVLASIAIFWVVRLLPGDPAAVLAGPNPTPDAVAAIRAQLALDQPLPLQYAHWLGGLFSGNLGVSDTLSAPRGRLIARGAGATAELTIAAMAVALTFGIGFGVLGAVLRRAPARTAVDAVNTVAFGVPPFVSGVALVLVLAVTLPVFPAGGYTSIWSNPIDGFEYLALPVVTLALPAAAVLARYTQRSLRRVLEEEFIRTATAKGVRPTRTVLRHGLPNALPSVLTVIGIQVGELLGGAVVVETVFAWPGLGQLAVSALSTRDYLLVQDLVMFGVAVFMVVQILTDILHAAFDPRIRLGATA